MKIVTLNKNLIWGLSIGAREDPTYGYAFAIVPDDFDGRGCFEVTSRHWDPEIENGSGDRTPALGLGDTPEEAWKEAQE